MLESTVNTTPTQTVWETIGGEQPEGNWQLEQGLSAMNLPYGSALFKFAPSLLLCVTAHRQKRIMVFVKYNTKQVHESIADVLALV